MTDVIDSTKPIYFFLKLKIE